MSLTDNIDDDVNSSWAETRIAGGPVTYKLPGKRKGRDVGILEEHGAGERGALLIEVKRRRNGQIAGDEKSRPDPYELAERPE